MFHMLCMFCIIQFGRVELSAMKEMQSVELLEDEYEANSPVFAPHIKLFVWNGILKILFLSPNNVLFCSTKTGVLSISTEANTLQLPLN